MPAIAHSKNDKQTISSTCYAQICTHVLNQEAKLGI